MRIPAEIKLHLIAQAFKRHGHISLCTGADMESSFTVSRDRTSIAFWFNDVKNSTHQTTFDLPAKDNPLVKHVRNPLETAVRQGGI